MKNYRHTVVFINLIFFIHGKTIFLSEEFLFNLKITKEMSKRARQEITTFSYCLRAISDLILMEHFCIPVYFLNKFTHGKHSDIEHIKSFV